MCIRCHIAKGYTTPTDRHIATRKFSPEESSVIGSFVSRVSGVLSSIQEAVVPRVASGNVPLDQSDELSDDIWNEFADHDDEFLDVYRESTGDGLLVGRELASRQEDLDIDFTAIPNRITDRLDEWTLTASRETMETMSGDVSQVLLSAHDEGLSLDETAQLLNDDVFDNRLKDNHAEMIARTETHSASEYGRHTAFEDSDAIVGERWVATLDDRVRDHHAAAHGTVVPVEDTFTVDGRSLRFPGDPNALPTDRINCRCSMVGVRADEMR